MDQHSKLILFLALSAVVLVLCSAKSRPTAATPLSADGSVFDPQTAADQNMVTSAQFANSPSNHASVPPLSLMTPSAGSFPQ